MAEDLTTPEGIAAAYQAAKASKDASRMKYLKDKYQKAWSEQQSTKQAEEQMQANRPISDKLAAVGKGALKGLGEGAVGLAMLPGDIASMGASMAGGTAKLLGRDPAAADATTKAIQDWLSAGPSPATTAGVERLMPESWGMQGTSGDPYQDYARTIGSFAVPTPGEKYKKGAGLLRTVLGKGAEAVGGGGLSEYLGEATKGTWMEPLGRIAGGIAGSTPGHAYQMPSIEDIGRLPSARLKQVLPTDTSRLQEIGDPGMVLNASPAATRLAGGLATKGGKSLDVIEQAINEQQAGTSNRLLDTVRKNLGPSSDLPLQLETIDKTTGALAGPLYEQAKSSGFDIRGHEPLITTMFEDIAKSTGNKTEAAGVRGWAQQVTDNLHTKDPQEAIQKLHDLRQSMDKAINWKEGVGYAPPTATEKAGAIKARAILNDVLKQVPGFAEADLAYERGATQKAGAEYGNKLLNSSVSPEQLQRDLAAERNTKFPGTNQGIPEIPVENVRSGARARIEQNVGNNANDLSALNKTLGGENDWNRAKLEALFPGDVSPLVDRVTQEQRMRSDAGRVIGNSPTAGRTEAAGYLEPGMGKAISSATNPTGLAMHGIATLLDRLAMPKKDLEKVAKLLTRNGPAALDTLAAVGALPGPGAGLMKMILRQGTKSTMPLRRDEGRR